MPACQRSLYRNPIESNLKAVGVEIKKARELAAGGIIGVNIMVATRRYDDASHSLVVTKRVASCTPFAPIAR